ncbi:MAG: hypothetical protein AB8F26_07460 [Phycisphaerales bacterium]
MRELIGTSSTVAQLARLRKDWSPEQIGVVTELAMAREKAHKKFPDRSERIVADREGVEMASSAQSAAHKAARFAQVLPKGAPILDACCGIGGDSIALAGDSLEVTAVDLDKRRSWMAGLNASCRAVTSDIREFETEELAVHIDPARRTGGNRTRTLDEFEPPFDHITTLASNAAIAAIKLNPGVHADLLPTGELEIISESGSLTQAVLWMGQGTTHGRRATLLAADGSARSISGHPDRTYDNNPISDWIHTMDPSLERANLVPEFLSGTQLRPIHPGTGLLTANEPSTSPWTTPYRVISEFAWNPRVAKSALRDLDAGVVTVKTRASAVNPDKVSRQLRGTGKKGFVLFVLPIADRLRAIITELPNVSTHKTPPDAHGTSGGAWMAEP